ncbi:9018_t:CDS:1 [Ambispora leptoticha]|uniref:9018_t:CDS:1 n=1 Tax=Ambispora leptoticha TaxID=144679 RepID=A0A9N9D8U5_9GLOM|nr:9018_t:CDS:1 [Ambispora leptoticha]
MVKEQIMEQLREELRQAREEIVRLKTQALVDINELMREFDECDEKRKEYETEVEKQASQREDRASTQFGWGQAINFVPVFSHAYNYGASKANELVEQEQKKHRETLRKVTDKKYKQIEESYIKRKKRYEQEN